MTPIQILLLGVLFVTAVFYFTRLRTYLLDRILMLIMMAMGGVMILRPDWAITFANILGVGRGADLVLYIGLLGLGFLIIILFSRLQAMQTQLTKLVRAIAIDTARFPDD